MKIYKKHNIKPYYFLLTDATLPSDNPLRFRQNLLDKILSNQLFNITLAKKTKTLNNKIETNEAQYPAGTRRPGDVP